jgi:hypothetical protein
MTYYVEVDRKRDAPTAQSWVLVTLDGSYDHDPA